jgi:hypothetical protein
MSKLSEPNVKIKMSVAVSAILLSCLCAILTFALGVRQGVALGPEMAGRVMSPVMQGLIVVGLFQIGARFRNQRSRLNIYVWVLFLIFLVSCGRMVFEAPQG